MTDDSLTKTDYGFRWGNVEVTRCMYLPGRGRTLIIAPEGNGYSGGGVEVYVSEGGRSVRVWKNGRELK